MCRTEPACTCVVVLEQVGQANSSLLMGNYTYSAYKHLKRKMRDTYSFDVQTEVVKLHTEYVADHCIILS